MKTLFLAVALLVCLASAPTRAQSIDGSKTPDLIPHYVAYGLVITQYSEAMVNSNVTPVTRRLLLQRLGLNEADEKAFLDILADHKARKDKALAEYNAKVSGHVIMGTFYAKHCELTADTRELFRAQLSPEGFEKVDALAEHSKHRMHVMLPVH